MKKISIPTPSQSNPVSTLVALKQNIEIITGVRSGPLETLPSSASTAEIVAKINEIIARLNA